MKFEFGASFMMTDSIYCYALFYHFIIQNGNKKWPVRILQIGFREVEKSRSYKLDVQMYNKDVQRDHRENVKPNTVHGVKISQKTVWSCW